MSLLSQFYPSGASGSIFTGMPDIMDSVGGVPSMTCYKGRIDANVSSIPDWDKPTATAVGLLDDYRVTYQCKASDSAGVYYLMNGSVIRFDVNIDTTDSALIVKNYSGEVTFSQSSPHILSGVMSARVDTGTAGNNIHTLHNCQFFGRTVKISGPQLVDTTTSYLAFDAREFSGFAGLEVRGAKLSAASVNKILIDCANLTYLGMNNFGAPTLKLDGGTSAGTADLSTEGAAALATLTGAGVTVSLN